MHHLETHDTCSFINKHFSMKQMAPNNVWKNFPFNSFYMHLDIHSCGNSYQDWRSLSQNFVTFFFQ